MRQGPLQLRTVRYSAVQCSSKKRTLLQVLRAWFYLKGKKRSFPWFFPVPSHPLPRTHYPPPPPLPITTHHPGTHQCHRVHAGRVPRYHHAVRCTKHAHQASFGKYQYTVWALTGLIYCFTPFHVLTNVSFSSAVTPVRDPFLKWTSKTP